MNTDLCRYLSVRITFTGKQNNSCPLHLTMFCCLRTCEYSGRQNASVRICGKQRSGGRKAPLEQLNCNTYPVGFPVKALPRQRCLQPLLERLQDIGLKSCFHITRMVLSGSRTAAGKCPVIFRDIPYCTETAHIDFCPPQNNTGYQYI